eukprot:Phypoly_transcript_20469.p1 GENE.Phypoly_transcript_20469~~Phypoly_transcript_20469.p1  ORF type:complete len:178 (+),score=6.00 Phypoly_transcript_20469:123-656(+)
MSTAHTPTSGTKAATEHLAKELESILKSPTYKTDGYTVEVVDDNLYKWHVKLHSFEPPAQIFEDLFLYESETGRDHVLLEVLFPADFPGAPPFIRVVYPRFHQYTGHITIGGSICIHDLTRSGWNSKNQMHPFFVMVRNLLLEGAALIDMDNAHNDYTEAEARGAFTRVALQHGWQP